MAFKQFSILPLLIVLLSSPVSADTLTADVQRMLNKLGYKAGSIDGAYGKKTKGALEAFYSDNGTSYDDKLDANELADLTKAMSAAGIDFSMPTGSEIESNGNLIYPPKKPQLISERYWWTHAPTVADFDNDGIMDIWITGTQIPDDVLIVHVDSGDACGKTKTYCKSPLTKPSLFIGMEDGKYSLRDDLILDDRKKPGHSLARQNLTADFNNDGKLDVFVGDIGLGSHEGYRDSYFLSQPDGTLLESSSTHLSNPNLKAFSHGAATGDIDGDGHMDVVITDMRDGGTLHCLLNDGTGYLKKRACGSIMAFAIELADMDGDGDLDIIHSADDKREKGNFWTNWQTGIAYNNGKGKFTYGSVKLSVDMKWHHVPELNVCDIDEDGDQDIILGRVQKLYAGVAIQIFENLGNGRQFISTTYELLNPPAGFVAKGEGSSSGNFWNRFIEQIRFADVDQDGDTDIMLINEGDEKLPNGSYMRNDGRMKFTFMRGPKGSQIKVIPSSSFTLTLNGRSQTPYTPNGMRSSKEGCENAIHDGQWDMDVNPKWVAAIKQRGFDLEMCLTLLAN